MENNASEQIFARGNGTKESPYQIANSSQLSEMSELVKKYPEKYAQAYYILTADIETDKSFARIGSEDNPFKGCLNSGIYDSHGNLKGCHCIKINSNCSLFGHIGGEPNKVHVCNLALDGNLKLSADYAGGVAEYLSSGIIENVTLKPSMSIIGNNYATGGIVGGISGGLVKRCISYADVTGAKNVGGISGYSSGLTVECCNVGGVHGVTTAGGIVGNIYRASHANSYVHDCLNTGKIEAINKSCQVGGIIGDNHGADIRNCCSMIPLTIGNGYGLGINYYYSDTDIGIKEGIRKTAEEFENGSVSKLLNEKNILWEQGTVPHAKVDGLKEYAVLSWINRKGMLL